MNAIELMFMQLLYFCHYFIYLLYYILYIIVYVIAQTALKLSCVLKSVLLPSCCKQFTQRRFETSQLRRIRFIHMSWQPQHQDDQKHSHHHWHSCNELGCT